MAVSEDQNQQDANHPIDENELEQYGVWVKAGPEDVNESEAEDEAFSLADLSEDELTEAETDLLSDEGVSLEIPSLEEDTLDSSSLGLDDNLEEVSIDEPADSLELDSLELDTLDDEPAGGEELDSAELAVSGDEEELSELTLDDFTETVDADDELESLDLDIDETPAPAAAEDTGEELLSLEDEDLSLDIESEELGVDVSEDLAIEPDAIQAEPVDDLDLGEELELEDAPAGAPASLDEPSGDGPIDDSLSIDEDLPDDLNDLTLDLDDLDVDAFEESEAPAPVADLEEPETLDETDLLAEEPELVEAEPAVEELSLDTADEELDLSSLPGDEEGFGDLSADELTQSDEGELPELTPDDEIDLGDDLGSIEPEDDLLADLGTAAERQAAEEQTQAVDDRSLSLLESIERELSSIRNELGDLKRELGELRSAPAPAAPVEGSDEDETSGGFFDTEDDDESISLNPDEMANIMTTAEFTEETGEPTEFDDLLGPPEQMADDATIQAADAAVDEISLGAPEDESEPLELDLESQTDEPFSGSQDEVEALASMDIDAELADIEDLEDSTESMPSVDAVLPDLDLGMDESEDSAVEPPVEEVVLDAEPIDLGPVDDEPIPAMGDAGASESIPDNLKAEMKTVLQYLDQLLEALPEDKITEFAQSDHFTVYQQLFKELGLEQ